MVVVGVEVGVEVGVVVEVGDVVEVVVEVEVAMTDRALAAEARAERVAAEHFNIALRLLAAEATAERYREAIALTRKFLGEGGRDGGHRDGPCCAYCDLRAALDRLDPEPQPSDRAESPLCGCGHRHSPGTECDKWWRYPDVQTPRECACTDWWTP